MFKALQLVSHGKSAPENGFLKNKVMVNVHEAKKKNKAMKSQELSVLRASLGKLWNSLTVTDGKRMMVKEGNKQLKQLLTLKNCTKWNYTMWNWDGSETNSRAWNGSESFEKEVKRNKKQKSKCAADDN